MKPFASLILAFILLIGLAVPALADYQDTTDKNGELTIPWDEFKTLLNLDDDKIVISLETFQKLLAQTGVKYTPAHTVTGGNIVLSKADFENLVNKMKAPIDGATDRPVDYLITKAIYDGKMTSGSTAFTANFKVHVLKESAYVRIPIVPASVPLEDITVDGQQALVINENGYHTIVLSKSGEYTVRATFSLASSLDKGPNKIDLAIFPTPITLLNLQMPLKDIDVEIPQAQQVLTSSSGNTTIIKAAIATGNNLSVRWRKRIAPTEKIPAKLHAELYHLLSIEDGAMAINTDINLKILHSEIDGIHLSIPKNLHILSVSGEGVGDWQEVTRDNGQSIFIPFTYGKKGDMVIRVVSEIPSTEAGIANVFSSISVNDVVRETGFIGVVLNTSAEVSVAESDGLEIVPAQKLPQQIVNKSSKPLTMGFKYLKHPYNLVLDVKKHDKVSVPVATIDAANVVTLFTEDGKIVHRLVYQVKNSAKQFLHIRMPADADVWSVLVDNRPVESSVNDSGELLVPLNRSQQDGNGLKTFPVEVIYCQVESTFDWLGNRESALPSVDLLISQVMWSVYLPNDYTYHHFSSSLEIEQMVRGVNIFSGAQRQYDERVMSELSLSDASDIGALAPDKLKKAYGDMEYESKFRNIPMPAEQLESQVLNEVQFSGRMEGLVRGGGASSGSGVLPIQIQVPTGGQVYRFARTIIKPEDPLTMQVTYSRYWATGLLKWALILIAVMIVWFNRRKFGRPWRWLKEKVQDVISFVRKHEDAIGSTVKNAARSTLTPVVLFGLAIATLTVSLRLTVLFLLLFWVSASYHALNYRRRRLAARAKEAPAK